MKYKRVFIISLIFLIIVMIMSNISFGMTTEQLWEESSGLSDIKKAPDGYTTTSGVGKVINIIIGVLQIAGTGISIIMVTVLGIKYMLASVEEKAEIKKQATPIVIGAILLFGAVNLMAAVEDFASNTLNK